jgi:hypothetical protein
MAWTWGTNTINPGQSQRWWLWWPGDPGLEFLGVQAITPAAEIQYTTPGVQRNTDGSTTYFITVSNVGALAATYHFRGSALSWTWGDSTLNPGESQRWWLWWPTYPGLEVIGVQTMTPGAEIDCTAPSMQVNPDGSATYFLTITNVSARVVEFHFRGSPIC